jgi:uncharacterized protein HemY
LLEKDEVKKGLAIYSNLIKKRKNDKILHIEYIEALYNNKDAAFAEQMVALSKDKNAHQLPIFNALMARVSYENNVDRKVLDTHINRANEFHPNFPRLLWLRHRMALDTNDNEAALEAVKALSKKYPNDVNVLISMLEIYVKMKDRININKIANKLNMTKRYLSDDMRRRISNLTANRH